MSGNTFGHLFRVTTFGESPGPGLGVIIAGILVTGLTYGFTSIFV